MISRKTNPFKVTALVSLIMAGMGVAIAEEPPLPPPAYVMTAEEIAEEKARRDFDTYLASVVDNRDSIIDDIVADRESFAKSNGWDISYWAEEFRTELENASDWTLAKVLDADTYDDVVAILSGGKIIPKDLSGTEDIGDTTADLVFTPVTPCRIFDTRYDADGSTYPGAGTSANIKHYWVHGTAAQLYVQGHNNGNNSGSGCVSPGGEPSAIAANFTAAATLGNGHIRAWPYGRAQPTASFLNYVGGSNLANAGIIATRRNYNYDISVSTWYGQAHSLADVMGYYYPIDGGQVETQTNYTGTFSYINLDTTACYTLNSMYIYVPESGRVEVSAQATYLTAKYVTGYKYLYQYIQQAGETPCALNAYNQVYFTPPYYLPVGGGAFKYETLSQNRTMPMSSSGYVYLRAKKSLNDLYAYRYYSSMTSAFYPAIP